MGHFGILLKIHYKDIMRTQEDKSGAHWGSAPTADAYCYNCGPKDGLLILKIGRRGGKIPSYYKDISRKEFQICYAQFDALYIE